MQYSTQYNQSYSRKIQIDNAVIMNTFRKAMSLLSYSFITSRIFMCLFLESVSKNNQFSLFEQK